MDKVEKLIRGLIDQDAPAPEARLAAELAARMARGLPPEDAAQVDMMELAAQLDGEVKGEVKDGLDRACAQFSQDYQELAASAELVDTVTANMTKAPADLLAQAKLVPTSNRPGTGRRTIFWLWLGGAVVAAALVTVLFVWALPSGHDAKAPLMATPERVAPKAEGKPQMVPAGNEDVVPPHRDR